MQYVKRKLLDTMRKTTYNVVKAGDVKMSSIGQKVKALRKKHKLTQVELGAKIGVSGATVTRYENGNITLKYDTLKKIAEKLNEPLSELLTDGQLEWRKEEHGKQGLQFILESMYDNVTRYDHHTVDSDGVPEYDGNFTFTLSKKGQADIEFHRGEFEALLKYVLASIPAHIDFIQNFEPPEPDNYHGE